jgi:hypothetical protein
LSDGKFQSALLLSHRLQKSPERRQTAILNHGDSSPQRRDRFRPKLPLIMSQFRRGAAVLPMAAALPAIHQNKKAAAIH